MKLYFFILLCCLPLAVNTWAKTLQMVDEVIVCEGQHAPLEQQTIQVKSTKDVLDHITAKDCLKETESFAICQCSKKYQYENTKEQEDRLRNFLRGDFLTEKSLPRLAKDKASLLNQLNALYSLSLPLPETCQEMVKLINPNSPCKQEHIEIIKRNPSYSNILPIEELLYSFSLDEQLDKKELDLTIENSKLALELISKSIIRSYSKTKNLDKTLNEFDQMPGFFTVEDFGELLEKYPSLKEEEVFGQAQSLSTAIAYLLPLKDLISSESNIVAKDLQEKIQSKLKKVLEEYRSNESDKLNSLDDQCSSLADHYANLCPDDGQYDFNYSASPKQILSRGNSFESPLILHNFLCSQAEKAKPKDVILDSKNMAFYINSGPEIPLQPIDPSHAEFLAHLGNVLGSGAVDYSLGGHLGGGDKENLGFDSYAGGEPLDIGTNMSKGPVSSFESTSLISKLSQNKWIAKGLSFGKKFQGKNDKEKAIADFFKKARQKKAVTKGPEKEEKSKDQEKVSSKEEENEKKDLSAKKKPLRFTSYASDSDDSEDIKKDKEKKKEEEDEEVADDEQEENEKVANKEAGSSSLVGKTSIPTPIKAIPEKRAVKRKSSLKDSPQRAIAQDPKEDDIPTSKRRYNNSLRSRPYNPNLPVVGKKINPSRNQPLLPIPWVKRAAQDGLYNFSQPRYFESTLAQSKKDETIPLPPAQIDSNGKARTQTSSNGQGSFAPGKFDNGSSNFSNMGNRIPSQAKRESDSKRLPKRRYSNEDDEEEYILGIEFDKYNQRKLLKLYRELDGKPLTIKRKKQDGLWYLEVYVLKRERGLIIPELKNFQLFN